MPPSKRTKNQPAEKTDGKRPGKENSRVSAPPSFVPLPANVNPEFVPLPRPGRNETATEVLDRSLVFNLVTLTNKIASENSRILLSNYGMGVAGFQVLRFLRLEPHCTPTRICAVTTMDKSVVSRALQGLAEMGLVKSTIDPTDSRRQFWVPTAAGFNLSDEAMGASIERQRLLLSGFSDQEIRTLFALLKRAKANVHKIRDAEPPVGVRKKQPGKHSKKRR